MTGFKNRQKDGKIIISDLDKWVDKKYIDADNPTLWRPLVYQAEDFSGVMLGEGEGPEIAPITVRLGVKGSYRVWLGMCGHFIHYQLRVRLSNDICCQRIGPPEEAREPETAGLLKTLLYEVFWKEADLTGQDLILEGGYKPAFWPGALAYICLEPIEKIRVKPSKKVSYPLAITNDGEGIFGKVPHFRPEDLLETFEEIPEDSCMRMLIWGIGGGADRCNYPTKTGSFLSGVDSFRDYEHLFFRNTQLWKKKKWDGLQLVKKYAQKRKWEFQVYIRMEAFTGPFPFDRLTSSGFFNSHPEYHCFDCEGQRVARLSYAYPEVQKHMLNIMREIVKYNPDGICLCFIRGVPMVLYEPIMVKGFMKKYGIDPRKLKERDPRWTDYQAEVITSFIKKIKAVLKPSQRLSAIVPGNKADCKRWGLDIPAWVQEGVVNDLLPMGQKFNKQDVHYDGAEDLDFGYFNKLKGRDKIRLIPMLYPWDKFQQDYSGWRQLIYSFLDQGADAYGVWDATEHNFPRVGDIGYKKRTEHVPPKAKFRKKKLLTCQGFRIDRYHPYEVV